MKKVSHLGFKFKQINEKFRQNFNQKLSKYDITFSQFLVLEFMYAKKEETVTQKDIENYTKLKHPTVIGILKRLEDKGFLRSAVNPDDKRFRNIILTDKAIVLKKELDDNKETVEAKLIEGMSDDEIEGLKRLLDQVIRNLSDL